MSSLHAKVKEGGLRNHEVFQTVFVSSIQVGFVMVLEKVVNAMD